MKGLLVMGLVVALLVVGAIAYERMLWNECRQTNSWFYCVRILDRK